MARKIKKVESDVNRSQCIYFPGDLWDRVFHLAAHKGVSVSGLVRVWAEEGLAKEQKKGK